MDAILEGLGKFLGGGILSTVAGGVLGLLSKAKDIELAKIQNAHAIELAKLNSADARAAALEAAKQADLTSLQAAIAADKATYGDSMLGKIVDFLRGIIRPTVTLGAFGIIVWTTSNAISAGDKLGIQSAVDICAIPIGYWFGSRFSSLRG